MSTTDLSTGAGPLTRFLGVVTERQTYRNLLYLVLAFPLGFFYGMVLGFGFVFGLVLSVVIVGVGILLGTVLLARVLATFERWLANALLRLELSEPDDRPESENTLEKIKAALDAASTWRGLGFLTLKFWVGIVGLLVLIFLVSLFDLLTAPLRYPTTVEFGELNDEPVTWTIDTLPEALLAVPLGVLVVLVLLHVSNGFAYATARMAEALLDGDRDAVDEPRHESRSGAPEHPR